MGPGRAGGCMWEPAYWDFLLLWSSHSSIWHPSFSPSTVPVWPFLQTRGTLLLKLPNSPRLYSSRSGTFFHDKVEDNEYRADKCCSVLCLWVAMVRAETEGNLPRSRHQEKHSRDGLLGQLHSHRCLACSASRPFSNVTHLSWALVWLRLPSALNSSCHPGDLKHSR